jgi:hypothetical protein
MDDDDRHITIRVYTLFGPVEHLKILVQINIQVKLVDSKYKFSQKFYEVSFKSHFNLFYSSCLEIRCVQIGCLEVTFQSLIHVHKSIQMMFL